MLPRTFIATVRYVLYISTRRLARASLIPSSPAASCSYVGFAYRTVDAFVADLPKNDELDDDLAFAESLPLLSPPPEPAAASFF